jgi:hypothetical protein
MTMEIVAAGQQPVTHLIATDPRQMADAQSDMQTFLAAKVKEVRSEVADVQHAHDVFPLNVARPQIMEATAQAMVAKCFDEIGICPQTKQADPLIIGRIATKRRGWQEPSMISFLIAWHLDLRTL